jgi:hypothetical protein
MRPEGRRLLVGGAAGGLAPEAWSWCMGNARFAPRSTVGCLTHGPSLGPYGGLSWSAGSGDPAVSRQDANCRAEPVAMELSTWCHGQGCYVP